METPLETEGRVWLRGALSDEELAELDRQFNSQTPKIGTRLKPVKGSGLNGHVQRHLSGAKAVRFVSFSKNIKENWSLPWHQDRVIAVAEKFDLSGFSHWSRKSGIWHCEPPKAVLANMIFARVYLNDIHQNSGGLELALGSHKFGKIVSRDVEQVVGNCPIELCQASRGDVLLVKALTLHRSGKSKSSEPRRVIRIDYSSERLPHPLKWKYAQI